MCVGIPNPHGEDADLQRQMCEDSEEDHHQEAIGSEQEIWCQQDLQEAGGEVIPGDAQEASRSVHVAHATKER